MKLLQQYITLLRPHQYIKNLFVFAPLLFSFKFYHMIAVEMALLAFLCFSLLSSSVYILNDIKDVEEDKQHPEKKFRPIANGVISVTSGYLLSVLLMAVSLAASYFISLEVFGVMFFYYLLNVAYSLKLKHIPIIDIFIIATGFVLRIFAGAKAISVEPTDWIILVTFLLSLFLALAKRRDDVILKASGLATRKNVSGYNLEFLNGGMIIMASVVIVSYIMYTVSPNVVERFGNRYLYLTTGYVILGILRYLQLAFVENKGGNPTKLLWKDRFLQITIILWLVTFLVMIS